MSALPIRAPAKINWTIEVLGKRPDGYHEIRSIIQTIDVNDTLDFEQANELIVAVIALQGSSDIPPEDNLVLRAAELLRKRAGCSAGARITLTKQIPVAAGLGGGSSDAAATLRALGRLWQIDASDDELMALGAQLGSDVPFFVRGGTALASGRGEQIEPLPDPPEQRIVVAWPVGSRPDKTARMYAALRQEHYTDGLRTQRLTARLQRGQAIRDEDVFNVFEAVLPEVDRDAAELFEKAASLGSGRPHLCGSGPAFLFLLTTNQPVGPLRRSLEDLVLSTAATRTLPATVALAIEEP